MNLKQMEAFVRVAESGSFSKAAKVLYLTQPTVSAHISSLEKELNARLFVRNTKEVSLSEDGKILYKHARQMIDLENEILGIFAKDTKKEEKCVSIATSTIPAQYLLPDILMRLRKKYPHDQFKITESDSADVAEQVAEHLVDIGFTGTVMDKKNCQYIPFYKDELVIIMPNTERYQEIQKREHTLNWILAEPIIMREEGSGTRKEAEKRIKKAGIEPTRLHIVANVENPETIKKSVKSGIGITIISKLAAQEEIESGAVLEFPMDGGDGGRNLNLVYNKNYQLSAAADRVIRVVKEMYPMARDGK